MSLWAASAIVCVFCLWYIAAGALHNHAHPRTLLACPGYQLRPLLSIIRHSPFSPSSAFRLHPIHTRNQVHSPASPRPPCRRVHHRVRDGHPCGALRVGRAARARHARMAARAHVAPRLRTRLGAAQQLRHLNLGESSAPSCCWGHREPALMVACDTHVALQPCGVGAPCGVAWGLSDCARVAARVGVRR